MPPLSSSLASLPAATWIDIVCAAVVLVFTIQDAIRGLSATIARLASLVAAFKLAFLLYPRIAALLPASGAAAPALSFGLTILVAFIIFLLLKFLLTRVIHVILVAPLDNILGALAGAVKGILLVFVAFSVIALVTRSSYSGTAFAKSRTGAKVIPAVERILAPAGTKLPCSSGER